MKKHSFLILFLLAMFSLNANSQGDFDPLKIKASFITNFIKFTRWPDNQIKSDNSIYDICIIGRDPYSKILQQYPKQGIQGRPLKVSYLELDISSGLPISAERIEQCHVLVVLFDDKEKTKSLLNRVATLPVLTISEITNGHEQVSMINIVNKNNQIAFSINRNSAKQAGIEFSSKLLRLAEQVIGGGR